MHPRKVIVEWELCRGLANVESCRNDVTRRFFRLHSLGTRNCISRSKEHKVSAPNLHTTNTTHHPAMEWTLKFLTFVSRQSGVFVSRRCWHLAGNSLLDRCGARIAHSKLNHGVLYIEGRCLWVGDIVLSVFKGKWTTKRVQFEGQNVRRKC